MTLSPMGESHVTGLGQAGPRAGHRVRAGGGGRARQVQADQVQVQQEQVPRVPRQGPEESSG